MGSGCPPAPENMGLPRILHSSEFASVIYGLMLLLDTPVLIPVLPAPEYLGSAAPVLATQLATPQRLCSGLPTCCVRLGTLQKSPSCLQSPRRKGMKGAGHSSGLCPAWLGEVPCSPFPSCLLSLILSPRSILRTSPATLIVSLWVGETAVHEGSVKHGEAGRFQEPDPLWGCGGSSFCCCPAVPDRWGVGHTDNGVFVFLFLCH